MAAAKRQQTSTVLYTLITFITLFIITTAFAVIYYVKFEEQRKLAEDAQNDLDRLASSTEMRSLDQIVGITPGRTSALGAMSMYLDQMIDLITGDAASDTAADIKIRNTTEIVEQVVGPVIKQILPYSEDSNIPNLMRVVDLLRTVNRNLNDEKNQLQQNYDSLYSQYQTSIQTNQQTEQRLNDEIGNYLQQVNEIKTEYAALENLLEQTKDEQVQTLLDDLKIARNENEDLRDELLRIQAELDITTDIMRRAQAQVERIMPIPDSNAPAYEPDGRIILVDAQSKIVHINIGSDDGVYRGLTFAVYDKNMPTPKDGKGKAEIEVFDVGGTISAARITTPVSTRNPIIAEDSIANLIWDKNRVNYFVVNGDFEYGDEDKINDLIQKWGGVVEDDVTINTDFVVLGKAPVIPQKPSLEQQDLYPTSLDEYNASRDRNEKYKEILEQAKSLSLPIFNTERFLYFTGYKERATKPGAF